MEKYLEVLSPAGDMESLKVAIMSGADAVYLGLGKFNARMKAENIGLDTLEEAVNFAHLRGVKVYVTINTLLSNSEINDLVEMVGKAIEIGVDAFIVQDWGVINCLTSLYPGIVLHGSTQMGVHNVRGARVAKKMGLSRVVLSREATLEDICDISKNVDIELEVFVHGAMCVAFSGNCYMSSLKFGASGNRGLCKQLCRLPYTLMSKDSSLDGYILSPRDNCMIEYLGELKKAGVVSLKIEGRLRRPGYVGVATRVYRQGVDCLNNGTTCNISNMKKQLAKVFSRGDFAAGYNNGKGIIDIKNNNHLGELVGKIVGCEKFKDIYRIVIKADCDINRGDGLKVVCGERMVTFGVGNVEHNGKNIIVFAKNVVDVGSLVYRVLDSEFEKVEKDLSKKKTLNIKFVAKVGSECFIVGRCEEFSFVERGAVVEESKTRPLTAEGVLAQLSKGLDEFELGDVDTQIEGGGYLPVAEINRLRRNLVDGVKKQILDSATMTVSTGAMPTIREANATYGNLAIVNEKANINLLTNYEGLILAPTFWSVDVVESFYKKYTMIYKAPLVIKLPIIALKEDLKIVDSVVAWSKGRNVVLMASNIYALDYITDGHIVWVGSDINVTNKYAQSMMIGLGVKEIVWSIEPWCEKSSTCYKMCDGKRVLMTMAHCPNLTMRRKCICDSNNGCSSFFDLVGNKIKYSIRKYRVGKCYFELVDSVCEKKTALHAIDDLRE